MSFKKNLNRRVLGYSVLLSLAACSPSTKAQQQPCATDMDCPGQELCLESICTGGSCVKDNDCPGDYICSNSYCISPITALPTPRTPLDTWSGMKTALQNNDLERVVSYFSPHVQDNYREILSHQNLVELAGKLPDLSEADKSPSSSAKFRQYEFFIPTETPQDNTIERYAVTYNCENEICQIVGF